MADGDHAAPPVPSALPPAVHRLREQLEWRAGGQLRLCDLSGWNGVPVALGVLTSPEVGLALGAAAAPTIAAAATKAAVEAVQTWRWALRLRRAGAAPQESALEDFADHVALWADPARRDDAAWLTAGETATAPPVDAPTDLPRLLLHLAGRGHEILLVDLTPVDLADAGISVVRAVGVDACWLDVGGWRATARPRLRIAAERRGRPLNLAPHPFP